MAKAKKRGKRAEEPQAAAPSPVKELEITSRDLRKAQPGFEALRGLKLKSGAGIRRIGKLLSVLALEFRDLQTATDALIEAVGEEKPGGGGYWIDPENEEMRARFDEEYAKLLDEAVTVRFRPIRVKDFGRDADIPMAVFSDLSAFIDFEEDEIPEEPEEEDSEDDDSDDEDSGEEQEQEDESE